MIPRDWPTYFRTLDARERQLFDAFRRAGATKQLARDLSHHLAYHPLTSREKATLLLRAKARVDERRKLRQQHQPPTKGAPS
jgi:hypothetical protein